MSTIAIAFGLLVILIIAMKALRIVASGCVKLIVVAVLLAACGAAYWYFKTHLVLPE